MADRCFTHSSELHTKFDSRKLSPENFQRGKNTKRTNIRIVKDQRAGTDFSINAGNETPISMELNKSCHHTWMYILKDSRVHTLTSSKTLSAFHIFYTFELTSLIYMHEKAGLFKLSGENVSILCCKTLLRLGGRVSRWKMFRWRCLTSKCSLS